MLLITDIVNFVKRIRADIGKSALFY